MPESGLTPLLILAFAAMLYKLWDDWQVKNTCMYCGQRPHKPDCPLGGSGVNE